MHNELTNLLPPERLRALRRDYFVRLGIVGVFLVIILTLAAAILLLPTFVLLTTNESAAKIHLASIESSLSSSDDAALSAKLAALSNSAASLSALANTRSVSMTVRTILAVPSPGVTLSHLEYSSATDTNNNPNTLTISGIAATRDALRSYQLALQGSSFVHSADLPVSAYAKDTNITFTITVTLAP